MNSRHILLALLFIILVSGCTGGHQTAQQEEEQAQNAPGPQELPEEGALVQAYQHTDLGVIMTDNAGRTVYTFTNDPAGESTCYDQCAVNWPPFLITGSGTPQTPEGFTRQLGVTIRTDGGRQLTYGGQPLYYYKDDTTQGDAKGHGVNNVWFVVKPLE